MNWHILGGGAIGSLWASRLSHFSRPYIIQRNSSANSFWLTLEHPNQAHEHCLMNSTTAKTLQGPINALLVTTKSQQTRQAVNSVFSYINSKTIIVLLQNGMGNQQWLQQLLPNNPLYAGICTDGVWRAENNKKRITIAGYGTTTIGPLNHHASKTLLQNNVLHKINWRDDIWPTLWEKLAINCAINGLTAIHQCRNGELLTIEGVEQKIHHILKEVAAVAQANQCHLSLHSLTQSVNAVIKQTWHNYSSMYQDVAAKRESEIDAINGYICREGKKHQITTPANNEIEQAIIQLQQV